MREEDYQYLLRDINIDIDNYDFYHSSRFTNDELKQKYFNKCHNVIKNLLRNIESTITHHQPIYREISSCSELENIIIQEPIGKYWSYTPETYSFWHKNCENNQEGKPFLIKGTITNPKDINIDQSIIVNLNFILSGIENEHEIRLNDNAEVHVDELCEKNWWGRKSSSGEPMIKRCIPINKKMKN